MTDLFMKSLFDTWQVVPRVLIVMFVSLYASQVLIEQGLFKKFEFIGRPLASLANLPREAGITFVASFGSVIAGNAMIAKLYQDRRIDSGQTLLSPLLNTMPVYLADYVQPLTEFFKLRPASVIPVGTYMFSPLVGASLIGTMIKDGILSDLQGFTACLLGSLLMLPIFAVRYSLAKYVSIFGFSMGSKILFVSTGLGMLNRVVFLMFF